MTYRWSQPLSNNRYVYGSRIEVTESKSPTLSKAQRSVELLPLRNVVILSTWLTTSYQML